MIYGKSKEFLDLTRKNNNNKKNAKQAREGKTDQMVFLKTENFCFVENFVGRMKR